MSLTMLDLQGEAGKTYYTGPVAPLRKAWIGFVLAFALLVTEILGTAAEDPEDISVILLLLTVAGWWYWLACVQRFHTILNQIAPFVGGVSTYPFTPRQAIIRHFIPLFNLFWVFKWPLELSGFLRANTSVRIVHGALLGLILFLGLLVRVIDGFVGFSLILFVVFYISGKVRQAVAEHESLRNAAEVFT